MSKLSNFGYKTVMWVYKRIPFQRSFCMIIRASHFPLGLLYHDLMFRGKFKVTVARGKSFYLFHHGGTIENEIFWHGLSGSWDKDTAWIWKELCMVSDVIFDIGANCGIYSLVAKAVNPYARVYAFEPSVNTFSRLTKNNEINAFDIRCEQMALSDINGEQVFYDTTDTNQTSASLSPVLLKNNPEALKIEELELLEYKVKTMTAVKYIESSKIEKIDLIKLDVELHEPEVIEGLGKFLTQFKPVIIIEILRKAEAERLNALIGDDFIKLHLKGEGKAELSMQFEPALPFLNYLVFHKDLTDKIRQSTSIRW